MSGPPETLGGKGAERMNIMNAREKVMRVFERKEVPEGAMWTGHPSDEIIPVLSKAWNIEQTREAVFQYLNDDIRWIGGVNCYHAPDGRPALDAFWNMEKGKSLSCPGCFAECEVISEIEAYPWPDVKYMDFTDVIAEMDKHQDKMILGGIWSGFFQDLCNFFGMENYFVKMYTDPEVVEAATEHIVDYYVAANDKMLAETGTRSDVMFIGNDFGTQRNLMISPEMFRKFVMPSLKRLIDVGKKHHKKVMVHSCGSIYQIIPDLIDAGVDILHPLQAQAFGMSAQELKQYKNDIAFVGGIDAQSFFVNATPQQIKDEVHRVRDILGPGLVVSPSHEEILPNVPPENIKAMAEAARE